MRGILRGLIYVARSMLFYVLTTLSPIIRLVFGFFAVAGLLLFVMSWGVQINSPFYVRLVLFGVGFIGFALSRHLDTILFWLDPKPRDEVYR
jgi:hypothetical protein